MWFLFSILKILCSFPSFLSEAFLILLKTVFNEMCHGTHFPFSFFSTFLPSCLLAAFLSHVFRMQTNILHPERWFHSLTKVLLNVYVVSDPRKMGSGEDSDIREMSLLTSRDMEVRLGMGIRRRLQDNVRDVPSWKQHKGAGCYSAIKKKWNSDICRDMGRPRLLYSQKEKNIGVFICGI